MAGTRINVAVIGWGLTYLILVGVIGLELDWGRHIRLPLPVPKPILAMREDYTIQPEFTLLPLAQGFAETTARPVFIPVRRPPPPPDPTKSAKAAMIKGQFIMHGALIYKDKRIALLFDVAAGKAIRVEQGKEIKGITVAKVLPEKVTLTQYDDTEELVLKVQPSARLPATPKTAPVQQPSQQSGQAAGAPQKNAPSATAPVDGGVDGNSLINRRRAMHGLPPI